MHFKIKIKVRAIVHTKEGGVFKKYPWKSANSLIKAFIQILMAQMSGFNQTIKNTSGVNVSVPASLYNFSVAPGAGITTYGILIGPGTTPVTMEDYKLEAQITTNVPHGAQGVTLENPNSSTWRIVLTRVFTNNTGGVLGIKEVGFYTLAIGPGNYFCCERTLYSVDVPDGYPITFQYRITITL